MGRRTPSGPGVWSLLPNQARASAQAACEQAHAPPPSLVNGWRLLPGLTEPAPHPTPPPPPPQRALPSKPPGQKPSTQKHCGSDRAPDAKGLYCFHYILMVLKKTSSWVVTKMPWYRRKHEGLETLCHLSKTVRPARGQGEAGATSGRLESLAPLAATGCASVRRPQNAWHPAGRADPLELEPTLREQSGPSQSQALPVRSLPTPATAHPVR